MSPILANRRRPRVAAGSLMHEHYPAPVFLSFTSLSFQPGECRVSSVRTPDTPCPRTCGPRLPFHLHQRLFANGDQGPQTLPGFVSNTPFVILDLTSVAVPESSQRYGIPVTRRPQVPKWPHTSREPPPWTYLRLRDSFHTATAPAHSGPIVNPPRGLSPDPLGLISPCFAHDGHKLRAWLPFRYVVLQHRGVGVFGYPPPVGRAFPDLW